MDSDNFGTIKITQEFVQIDGQPVTVGDRLEFESVDHANRCANGEVYVAPNKRPQQSQNIQQEFYSATVWNGFDGRYAQVPTRNERRLAKKAKAPKRKSSGFR